MVILEFIFQSFWHFIGILVLLSIIVQWEPFGSTERGLSSKQFDELVDSLTKKQSDSDA
jgi:hypothetical protein